MADKDGKINPESLKEENYSVHRSRRSNKFSRELFILITKYCDFIKENITVLAPEGVFSDTRLACLDSLCESQPSIDKWKQLVRLGHLLLCITSKHQ